MVSAASKKAKAQERVNGKANKKKNKKGKNQDASESQASPTDNVETVDLSPDSHEQVSTENEDLSAVEPEETSVSPESPDGDGTCSARPGRPETPLSQQPTVHEVPDGADEPTIAEAEPVVKALAELPEPGEGDHSETPTASLGPVDPGEKGEQLDSAQHIDDWGPRDTHSPAPTRDDWERTATPVAHHHIFSPIPAAIPLPSPSLSEVRLIASPPPYPYLSYPGSPPFHAHIASPVPKVSSPLARSYVSPVISPRPTPPVHHGLHYPAPSTAYSFATAQSPAMSTVGVIPPYAPYPHQASHVASPDQGCIDPYPAQSLQPLNLLANGQLRENGTMSPPQNDHEHDHIELLTRVQNALPDLSRLMNSFHETKSKLSTREAEIQQIQSQHEQAIMHKDFYIEALQAQMRKTANESAEETGKLKNTINEIQSELGSLQDKQRELEESLSSSKKSREELLQTKAELEADIEKLKLSIQETSEAHAEALEEQKRKEVSALAAQKQELTELFEEIKAEDEKAAAEALEAREKEMIDEREGMIVEWEEVKKQMQASLDALQSNFDSNICELKSRAEQLTDTQEQLQSRSAELDNLKGEYNAKVTELEATKKELDATKAELDSTLEELEARKAEIETKGKELINAHEQYAGEMNTLRDTHSTELDGLRDLHSGEIANLRTSHEEQLSALVKELEHKMATLQNEMNDKEKRWTEARAGLEAQLSRKVEELADVEKDKERLEEDAVAREQQLQNAVDDLRITIDRMDGERERLKKTLNSLGEATDLKSTKGDTFFMNYFEQLSRLVVDLSKEHFSYLPIDPPKDILAKIPPELPSFFDNTAASRELRSAYIQHVVSKTLVFRIFQPFLFTLGRRFDKADTFFQMLSMDIRRKSVRREAFWRQQTLKAAYTTSDAKQSINVVAAVIVDEIIDSIKHFANPAALDALLTSVRKIVKLAAETWRHARVERELILVEMPPPEAEDGAIDDKEGWQEYETPQALKGGGDGSTSTSSRPRHVVLRTFPRIVREAAHEDFADDEEKAKPCVYSCGTVLYSDSPVVLARMQELRRKSTEFVGDGHDALEQPAAAAVAA